MVVDQVAISRFKGMCIIPTPITFNPKRAGLSLVYLTAGGGGGGADSAPPPLRSQPRSDEIILKFGTYVEYVNTNLLTKFQYC